MKTTKYILFALFVCSCLSVALAQDITVAAAADLSSVLPEVAARYEHQTGRKVRLNFGSSGQFFLQMENGAPFDLFFSADLGYPQRLVAEGFADANSLDEYAVGKLVLYVPNSSAVDPSAGLRVLLLPQVRRVAIANPKHAPYGRAAVEAMRSAGVYEALQGKLVMGENISQAAQFVQSGSADAGIIALALALSPAMRSSGRFVELPLSEYKPLDQAAVILRSSQNPAAARQFLDFLRRPAIAALLVRYGFTRPSPGTAHSVRNPQFHNGRAAERTGFLSGD
jgi:molybdate transport system substrate-binding protein